MSHAANESAGSSWSTRWHALARAAGIGRDAKILLALSGGADSVLLLHWLAAAEPRVSVRAAHVDHGLRGAESDGDARFSADLARALGVPFRLLRAELEPAGPALEARARAERYRLLAREAQSSGHTTIVTGHHSDDALETLLQRWMRGTALPGLRGPRPALAWHDGAEPATGAPVEIVRPLLSFRREEVRALLATRGLAWREDSSNADPRFTRSRVRHALLPAIERLCGPEGVEHLREFGRAIEQLEAGFARATAHLSWRRAEYAAIARGPLERSLGGVLARSELMQIAAPLRRRALWRLLTEGTGRAPSQTVLERLLADLAAARCTRHSLPRGWTLLLRADELHLLPPARALGLERRPGARAPAADDPRQLRLPFPAAATSAAEEPVASLAVPGILTLPDGRRISAEVLAAEPDDPFPTSGLEAELDAEGLPDELRVRWPAHGDRFRGLGAPGSKPLSRFLADRGIPREERARVPLVFAADELVWVAGIAPSERRRIRQGTRLRLHLALH
jgi:tRNA(Ile)-lysidine synthase